MSTTENDPRTESITYSYQLKDEDDNLIIQGEGYLTALLALVAATEAAREEQKTWDMDTLQAEINEHVTTVSNITTARITRQT